MFPFRPITIAALFAASLTAQAPSAERSGQVIIQSKALTDAFQEFEKKNPAFVEQTLRSKGLTTKEADRQLKDAPKGLLESTRETVQQVVDGSPSPQPIIGGQIPKILPDVPTLVPSLTSDEQLKLLVLSASVGRIERLDGKGGATLVGTGFVANIQEIVTNCHVIRAITAEGAPGKELLDAPSLRVDFADNPSHDPGKEFRILSVAGCPSRLGLDVGILRVEASSSNNVNSLPPKVQLAESPLNVVGRRVALIGYPNLLFPSDPLYRKLDPKTYAKVATIGVIQDTVDDPNGKFQYIHHTSDSDWGNSGSPLIDLSSNIPVVIGVHNCCYDSTVRHPKSSDLLPCSFVSGLIHRNSAVATWELYRDPVLSPLMKATSSPSD